ncbi:c-type cytochrome [Flavobacterium sp. 3HN19-14]|uniref:c-type cytochrome n=1 Tax=Flavobacterium sp. 3HN19-14 TaxID=3448133 RepID=UPI003EE06CCC
MIKYIFSSIFLLLVCVIFSSSKSREYSENDKFGISDSIYIKGQSIFERDCASCHFIGMNRRMTAPALGDITKLRKKDWLYNYTKNPQKMLIQGDKIAKKYRSEGWGLMPSFPNLRDSDLDAIYYFVEKRYKMNKKK